MTPLRRSLCVFFLLLLLLPAASVAQMGISRPAPITPVIAIISAMTEKSRRWDSDHGQDGNYRPGNPVHDRKARKTEGLC